MPMLSKRHCLVAIALLLAVAVQAARRSREQMRETAAAALSEAAAVSSRAVAGGAPPAVVELRAEPYLSLMGYEGGAFAVVSSDDLLPAVLGVAERPTRGDNPAFERWLDMMNTVAAAVVATGRRPVSVLPSAKKHPASVAPLLATHWGQTEPFNRRCPMALSGVRTVTGCVATSMAQVLYYHRYPAEPTNGGSQTIYYPYQNEKGTAVTFDFSSTSFDWDAMLATYKDGYTDRQADAVATLMLACGVASDMRYDVETVGGSGTLQLLAQHGLNNFLGFGGQVKYAQRGGNWTDRRWMDVVYTELAEHRPVIYGGRMPNNGGGHSFVIHGYREDGMVCVNWGWNGDADGYYDIGLLNPKTYQFSEDQDMVYNIKTADYVEPLEEVSVTEAGTLASRIPYIIDQGLRVTGPLNSTDLRALRRLLGCDERGVYTGVAAPLSIDLSGARIVAGGEPYLAEGTKSYTTADDEIPYKAFYNCQGLRRMVLPPAVKAVGDGAWGNCEALWTVVDPSPEGKSFVISDGCIYSADGTELLAVLPVERIDSDTLVVPEGVSVVHPYAFSGYQEIAAVSLPATLTELGTGAFRNTTSVHHIKLCGRSLPQLGQGVFAGMTGGCTLSVWAGLKNTVGRSSQWKDFVRTEEYGTTVMATTATREVGQPNPQFGYTVVGEPVTGEPLLECDATADSPAGTYVIKCLRGTVTGDEVDFIDGWLKVTEAAAEPSAIGSPRQEPAAESVYTLEGRRLSRGRSGSPAGGVYVSNRKKQIIR